MNIIMDNLPMAYSTDHLCRLCAKSQDKMMSIYSRTDKNQSFDTIIQTFLPFIDLNQKEPFPKHICCSCALTIIAFNDLWNTSIESNEKFSVIAVEVANKLKNSKNQPEKSTSNKKKTTQETKINYDSAVSDIEQPENSSITKSIQGKNNFEAHKVNECPSYSADKSSSFLMNALLQPSVINIDRNYEDDDSQKDGDMFRHSGSDHTYSLLVSPLEPESLCGRSEPMVKERNIDHTYAMWHWEKIASNLSTTESSVCKPSGELISFSCPVCLVSYFDQCLLIKHMKVMHPKPKKQKLNETKAPRPKPVICDRCQKKVPKVGKHRCCPSDLKAFYERQRVEVDGNSYYKCDQCPFFTQVHRNSLTSFRQHYKLHTTKFDVKCDQCPNRAFRTAQALKAHVDTVHNGIKRYECPECGKKFACRNTLQTHLLMHSGEKPYLCDECGKTFRHISKVHSHKRFTHRKEKNFPCSECGQRFATSHLVNMHMTRHTGARDFICQDCGKAFRTKKAMAEHAKAVHTQTSRYTCTVCNKSFKTRRCCVLHNKNKHGIELRSSDTVPVDILPPPLPSVPLECLDSVCFEPICSVYKHGVLENGINSIQESYPCKALPNDVLSKNNIPAEFDNNSRKNVHEHVEQ